MRRHGLKKGLSLLLVFCMILSLLPMTALAEEISEPSAAVEEQSPASGDTTAVDTGEDQQDEAGTGENGEAGTGETGEAGTGETGEAGTGETGTGEAGTEAGTGETGTGEAGEAGTEAGTGETGEDEEEKSFVDKIIDEIKDILTPITGEKTEEEKAAEEAAKKAEEEEAAKKAAEEAAKLAEEEAKKALAEQEAEQAAIEQAAQLTLTQDIQVSFTPITVADKPADGSTTGQPFSGGTGGSENFRIPALVTMPDGSLVAAADARWDGVRDGFGLDTIVSRSSNNGTTWKYTFANYLGDNGNTMVDSSSAFIDPCLAVDDSTVYMLVDLYPSGTYIHNLKTGTGFDRSGDLLLQKSDESGFNYYLSDGKIYRKSDDVQAAGYSVDAYFNLTDPDGNTTNLFFSNSPFKVLATSYLYLTKSTNGGKTWSEPMMLNPQVKKDSDSFYGVGPGRGLVTSSGRIMFPCYTYTNSDGNTSVIYSDDGGKTWYRGEAVAEQSSEAALVEADGRIYMFTRHGGYYVSENEGETWSAKKSVGITYNTDCQISAITYSCKIDGKTAILLSAPSDTSSRSDGRIFVGLVNEDGTIDWAYTYVVNNSDFAYSCLTELEDGSIALLYEEEVDYSKLIGTITFDTYSISEIALGATVEKYVTTTVSDVTLSAPNLGSMTVEKLADSTPYEGYAASVTYAIQLLDTEGKPYSGSADIKIPFDSALFAGCEEFIGTVDGDTFPVTLKDGYLVGTVPHFSEVTISGRAIDNPLAGEVVPITGGTKYVLDTDGITDGEYLIVYNGNALKNNSGSAGKVTVTINGNEATVGDTTGILWTFSGSGNSFTIQNGDYYLYLQSSRFSTTILSTNSQTCTITEDNGTYKISGNNRYLGYSKNRWTTSSSGTAVSLYRKTSSAPTWNTDLTKLQAQINTANALKEADYTPASWAVLAQALAAANNLNHEESFSTEVAAQAQQDEIDAAALALQQAIEALVLAPKTVEVTLYVGQVIKYNVASGSRVSGGDSTIATAKVSGTELTITGVAEGTTVFTVGQDTYRVTVENIQVQPVTVAQNGSKTLAVNALAEGQYVEWSSADASYVSVAGKYDAATGAYTNEGVIIGNQPTAEGEPVIVTAVVYNADGTVFYKAKWQVTVTATTDTNTASRDIYVNVEKIDHCDVYYSINGGELVKVNGTGVLINEETTGHYNLMFFAAPHEGYALTYMQLSNTDGQYYTLTNGNPDGTGSDAWPLVSASQETIPDDKDSDQWKTIGGSKHGFRWALLEGNMSIEQMKVLFSNAIALGCDGATNFTKNGSDNFSTTVKFVAQKLPEVEKTITGINDGAYTAGTKVELGDTINYTIRVIKPTANSDYGTITYSDIKLVDELTGGSWSNLSSGSTNSGQYTFFAGTDDEVTLNVTFYTFTTSLRLTLENYDSVVKNGTITNTADFSYSYQSKYSTGSLTASASAVAEIKVSIPEYVIDFGLPVTIDVGGSVLGSKTITGGTAQYGDVTADGTAFTYKPNAVLQGADYVTLSLSGGGSYGVAIYPATTVYYEEGFMSFDSNGFTGGSKGNGAQAAEMVGSQQNVYGYDPAYAQGGAMFTNASATSSKAGSVANFTFTGTGVDIYADCTTSSGTVLIQVYDGSTLKKMLTVDTHMQNGTTAVTGSENNKQAVSAKNVPIASIEGLSTSPKKYSVVITHVGSTGTVKLDGFRVHGTLGPTHDAYKADGENAPNIVELRDLVILSVNTGAAQKSEQYKDQIVNTAKAQVLNTPASAVLVTSVSDTAGISDEYLTDVIDNGPKNEVYLAPGETLVFTIDQAAQVGVKCLNGDSGKIESTGGTDTTVTAQTDMFYAVAAGTVTITNNGSGTLAVTELKFTSNT